MTREEFVANKQKELEKQWEAEYQTAEALRKQQASRDAETAKDNAARSERLAQEKALQANAKSLRDVETCPVCGTEVAKTAIVHNIYNTDDRCIRKPRLCKASGIITEDAWDMLSDAEKKNGFVIKGGATLAAVKTLKDHTDNKLNVNAPNVFGQNLLA